MHFANVHSYQNHLFGQDDLSFSHLPAQCLEGWVWNQFQEKTLALTFETPYTYFRDNPNSEWVNLQNLKIVSHSFLQAISRYVSVFLPVSKDPMEVQYLMAAYPDDLKVFKMVS